MATHHLPIERMRPIADAPAGAHNRLHPDISPVAEVDPGDELVVECRDGMDGELLRAASSGDLARLALDANHSLTGPVLVRGAQPGDVLVVETLSIEPDPDAATAVIPGFGLLAGFFDTPFLVRWRIAGGVARSDQIPGVAIRARPFLGAVAVAPSAELLEVAREREAALARTGAMVLGPEPNAAVPGGAVGAAGLRTIPPRENGGHLDIRQLTAGSRLLLPVHVPGALLSIGDMHVAQGDGESCGTAIEASGVARVRVDLRRAEPGRWTPRFPAVEHVEEPEPAPRRWFATTGIPLTDDGANADLDLRLAARRALEELVGWLVAERGLRAEQAYVLASVAADLRVSQGVNVPNGMVSAHLPLDVFEG
jgi:formamidase